MKRASSSGCWCRTCCEEQSRPQGDVHSAHGFHGINKAWRVYHRCWGGDVLVAPGEYREDLKHGQGAPAKRIRELLFSILKSIAR